MQCAGLIALRLLHSLALNLARAMQKRINFRSMVPISLLRAFQPAVSGSPTDARRAFPSRLLGQ
ncbi:hypothetical protein BRAS3843_1610037 [Bradyrhizobium sp. STM 3843]|nr:hypothetical protein BRAS3843_1610037 [Bradyrhizobium sp. STM 3843]